MTARSICACFFLLASGCLVAHDVAAQDDLEPSPGDSLALAFEREVFAYPEYDRRNPFKTLLTEDGGGPRFESLILIGILYSPFAGESLALFAEGTRTVAPANGISPELVTVALSGGTYRVREGETLGSIKVTSIERLQVTVELEEFGVAESRTMLLPRATSGGGP